MKKVYRFRSAVTGHFVKPGYAKRYPHLTIRQRMPARGGSKPMSLRFSA